MAKARYVTVVKKAGHLINEQYLDKLVEKQTAFIGAAVVVEGKMTVMRERVKPTKQAIIDIMTMFKDHYVIFSVGENVLLDDDMQPFEVLANAERETIAIACLDGDFDGYSVVDSAHASEYHVIQDFFLPKMKKILKIAQGEVKGVLEELNDETTKKDFANSWMNRGSITFMLTEGDPITLQAGNVFKGEFNWGYTSNSFGHVEQTISATETKAVIAEPEKPLSMADKMRAAAGKLKDNIIPGKTSAPDVVAENGTSRTGNTVLSNSLTGEGQWVKPDATLVNKKDLEKWYMDRLGAKPQGYRKSPRIWQKKDGSYSMHGPDGMQALSAHAMAAQNSQTQADRTADTLATAGTAEPREIPRQQSSTGGINDIPKKGKETVMPQNSPQPAVTQTKNVSTQHIPPAKTTPAQVNMEMLPLISPDQKKKVEEGFFKNAEVMRIIGEDGSNIFNPKLLKTLEAKFPNFAESFGIGTMDQVLGWPVELFVRLGDVEVRTLAKLAYDLKQENLRLRAGNTAAGATRVAM